MPKLPRKATERLAEREAKTVTELPRKTNAQKLHNPDMPVFPRAHQDDMTVLAVDPGGEHVGVVVGSRYLVEDQALDHPEAPVIWTVQAPGWRVYDYAEMTPAEFVRWFRPRIQMFDFITCEKFQLYPDKAKTLIGSEMPTSKLIGWLEFTLQVWNEELTKDPGSRAVGYPEIEYVSYMKEIHKGTLGVLRHTGIELVTPASPDHARSAEIHFWHALIRAGLVPGVTLS